MHVIEKYNNLSAFSQAPNLVFIFVLAAGPAYAIDSASVELGRSFATHDMNTYLTRVGAQWDWGRKWQLSDQWSLGGYCEVSLGYWLTNDLRADHEVTDFGLTPVFRIQRENPVFGVLPYVEFAIGAHLLTDKDISDRIRFSTSFQFDDQIALGFRFGRHGRYDLSFGVQHLSNAGIDHPNPGINFNQIRFQYHF